MSRQTITGELRKWRHDVLSRTVTGKMYNDEHDIWEDGEDAVIRYTDWYESANFFLAITHGGGCIKCAKDEQVFNGAHLPEEG